MSCSAPIDWSVQPLGRVPDAELARRLGCSRERVRQVRKEQGIAKHKKPEPVWAGLLGTVPDKEIAREHKISSCTVGRARKARDIPKHNGHGTDWSTQPLGKVSDRSLAKTLGLCLSTVREARVKREIAPSTPALRKGINWDAQPLGQVPDRVLAQRLGVSYNVVGVARKRRAIPLFRPKKNETT